MNFGAFIGLIIGAIIMFIIGYIAIAIGAKLTNTRGVTLGGTEFVNPDTLSGLIRLTKLASQKALMKIKKINEVAF